MAPTSALTIDAPAEGLHEEPAERIGDGVDDGVDETGPRLSRPAESGPRSIPVRVPSTAPLAGAIIDGKYRIDRYIGSGSMGVVAAATHLDRKAEVALKLLVDDSRDAHVRARFRQEAVAASRLSTDHVVRVFDVAESATGLPYLVMELLEGSDLEALLLGGPLGVARSVHLVLQALRGLDVAHRAGVIHRDLKPGNLFIVDRDGEPDFVKILDFGISKVEGANGATARLTKASSSMGTPLYMAPEQASDASTVGPATDIYAAGGVLYECLCGVPALVADSDVELLYKLIHVAPPRADAINPEVPPGLADIVARSLAKNPAERPRSAAAFAALLAPYADQRSARVLSALRVSERPPPPSSGREPATGPVATRTLVPTDGRALRIVTPPSPVPARTAPISVVGFDKLLRNARPLRTDHLPPLVDPRRLERLPTPPRPSAALRRPVSTMSSAAWVVASVVSFALTLAIGLSFLR